MATGLGHCAHGISLDADCDRCIESCGSNRVLPDNPNRPVNIKGLSDFTDDEIAAEYHRRMLRKLGDPSIGVHVPIQSSK